MASRVELVWMREGELCIPLGVENRVVRFYNLISLPIPPPLPPHTHTRQYQETLSGARPQQMAWLVGGSS